MMRSFPVAALLALSSIAACSVTVKSQPAGSSAREIPSEVSKSDSRVDQIIERANDHFRKGMFNLLDNKREQARDEFDKAVDEILMSGMDVQANERLQKFYLELVERIYREEVKQSPTLPPSERIKNPIRSADLFIPSFDDLFAQSPTSPQETSGTAASADSGVTKYRSRKGDTIAKIAAAHNLSADQVAKLNGIAANVQLQPGQEIKLPIIATEPALLENEYVKTVREYKASLERLLTLYLASEKRAEDRLTNVKKLYDEKLLFEPDLDQARKAVDDEREKVTETRRKITEAEKQTAEAVIEARDQQIKEARDRERADELIGPKPAQSANGAMPIVIKWFNDYLHDPYSARYVSWTKVRKGLHDGEPYWIVAVRLRAKNAFNAYRLSDYIFYIRRNRIVIYDAN